MTDREQIAHLKQVRAELRREVNMLEGKWANLVEENNILCRDRKGWDEDFAQLEADRDRLRGALERQHCPGGPAPLTVGECTQAGTCGCENFAALNEAATPPETGMTPSPDQPQGGGSAGLIAAERIVHDWWDSCAGDARVKGLTWEWDALSPLMTSIANALNEAATELTALRDVAEAAENLYEAFGMIDETEKLIALRAALDRWKKARK